MTSSRTRAGALFRWRASAPNYLQNRFSRIPAEAQWRYPRFSSEHADKIIIVEKSAKGGYLRYVQSVFLREIFPRQFYPFRGNKAVDSCIELIAEQLIQGVFGHAKPTAQLFDIDLLTDLKNANIVFEAVNLRDLTYPTVNLTLKGVTAEGGKITASDSHPINITSQQ